jgi:hypothetical protein
LAFVADETASSQRDFVREVADYFGNTRHHLHFLANTRRIDYSVAVGVLHKGRRSLPAAEVVDTFCKAWISPTGGCSAYKFKDEGCLRLSQFPRNNL